MLVLWNLGDMKTLAEYLADPVATKVPEGWLNTKQLAEKTGLNQRTVGEMARREGYPSKLFRVMMPSGMVRPILHYFVGKPKKA